MAIDLKSAVRRGKSPLPPRIVIYGPEGIGKSTFAADSGALVLPCEDGLGGIECHKTDPIKSLDEVMELIGALYQQEHDFTAVAIDTADALEKLLWDDVVAEANESNKGGAQIKTIEGFGYGRGYKFAMEKLRTVLAGLDALRNDRNMMVIVTAHAQIKRYDDPTSDPYDRYQLKMHEKSAELIKEWCDVLGFATQKLAVKNTAVSAKKEIRRALDTGGTILHLRRTPAFDAKNRYGLPDTLPFKWADFIAAFGG
jgi:putative NADPH-quinone reductase